MPNDIDFLKEIIKLLDDAIKGFTKVRNDIRAVIDKKREHGDQ